MAGKVGCKPRASSEKIRACLNKVVIGVRISRPKLIGRVSQVGARRLTEEGQDLFTRFLSFPRVFKPIVDDYALDDAFLPLDPYDLLRRGMFASDVPFINGFNRDEGLFVTVRLMANATALEELNEKLDRLLPLLLFHRYSTCLLHTPF